jgi:hypothetical protein
MTKKGHEKTPIEEINPQRARWRGAKRPQRKPMPPLLYGRHTVIWIFALYLLRGRYHLPPLSCGGCITSYRIIAIITKPPI